MRGLKPEEIDQVAGGPLVVVVVPIVKLSTATKAAAVGAGTAAGVAGATAALDNDEKCKE